MSAMPNQNIVGDYIRIKNRYSAEERLVYVMQMAKKANQLYLGVRFDMNPKLYWFNVSSKWEVMSGSVGMAA